MAIIILLMIASFTLTLALPPFPAIPTHPQPPPPQSLYSDLPVHLQEMILSHLNAHDLHTIRSVSHVSSDLVRNVQKWKTKTWMKSNGYDTYNAVRRLLARNETVSSDQIDEIFRISIRPSQSELDDLVVKASSRQVGCRDVVKMILENGANVNASSESGETALHGASWHGHGDVVRLLLDKGADVNAKNNYFQTALHEAAWKGHDEIVEMLLAAGAEVDAKNIHRRTPLHEAYKKGRSETVKILLRHGASLHAKDISRRTPLERAAKKRSISN